MFYFEDVFNRVIMLWKEKYFLSKKKGFFSLQKDFEEIDWYVCEKNKKKYDDWERVMIFIIYQVLGDYAMEFDSQNKTILKVKDIITDAVEKQWISENAPNLEVTVYSDNHKKYFNIKNIPINLFEKQFVNNCRNYKKIGYLEEYKEFKDNYKGFKNLALSTMTLGEYLKYHSLSLRTNNLE